MSRPVASLSYATRRETIERMAPGYREASFVQKGLLLDTVVATTGYARKYAIRLLGQAPEGKRTIERRRLPRYGQEVQQALFLAWKASRYICAKRLVPFLPTLVANLERNGRLHLTEESRKDLLSVSPATAERLLHSQRKPSPRGLSTTQAGPLLKQRIPIRTFEQWDETRPGFLEVDLVAHEGGHNEGCFLYTLTLTDVATGWTECLPLLSKSAEAVLSAFRQARRLFLFPILGLDVDNGSEFINEALLNYCESEQITFTRGRPDVKSDQCYVEQKNGAIVRQFVGFDRLVGEQAYRQLREVYRAVRLYVNCFQPSMKLVSKHPEGEKVRRVYDPAKTPLQRLLLSGILPPAQQQELTEVGESLDPLSLLEHLEDLQDALWRCTLTPSLLMPSPAAASLLRFSIERCMPGPLAQEQGEQAPVSVLQRLQSEAGLFDWPRTTRDPFEGEWETILTLVLTRPEDSLSDLFQELQHRSPGRYHPSHLQTLQHGVCKIRARLQVLMEDPWPHELIQGPVPSTVPAQSDQREPEDGQEGHAFPLPSAFLAGGSSQEQTPARARPQQHPSLGEQEAKGASASTPPLVRQDDPPPHAESGQQRQLFAPSLPAAPHQEDRGTQRLPLTIERAIQFYLQEHRAA